MYIEETKEYLTGVTDIKGFELYTEVTRIILEDLEKVNARFEAASKEVNEAN